MLKFTFDELVQIERSMERVNSALSPLIDKTTSNDILLTLYIIREVRHCAQTLEMADEQTKEYSLKAKAVDRLVSMLKQEKKEVQA